MTDDDALYCISEVCNLLTRMIDDPAVDATVRMYCILERDRATEAMVELQIERKVKAA